MTTVTRSSNLTEGRPARALVTGGAGFIGSHLAEHLLAHGYEVTVLDNLSTGRTDNVRQLASHPRFRCVVDSVANEAVVDQLVSECDVVFHLGAVVGVELVLQDPLRVFETNVLGSHCLLRAAARYQRKVLVASTSEIYGKSDRVPFREDDDRLLGPTTAARWSYSASKALDEFLALAYHRAQDLPIVIFRLFNTVGPRQTGRYGMVIPRLVQQALRGEPLTIYGDGQQTRCFCDVVDAVRAIIGLANCPAALGQVFNVGSTTEVSILELARRILLLTDESTGSSPGGVPGTSWKARESSRSAGISPARENRTLAGETPAFPGLPLSDDSAVHFGEPTTTATPWEERIRLVPYDRAYGPGFEDLRRRVPDTTRIKTTLGWEPRISLDETLRRVVAFHLNGEASVPSPAANSMPA